MTEENSEPRSPHVGWRLATGVVSILALWFAIANIHNARINFWVTSVHVSVIVVIVVSMALGAMIAVLWRRASKRL